MKIKELHFSRLRNNEHFEFMRHVTNLVREYGAAALRVEPQFTALTAAHAKEDEVLMKISKSALTARIAEADAARDEVYRGLMNTVRAASVHFTPAVREAGERVSILTDTYGNAARLAVEEETSALANLLKDLLTKYGADAETLGLVPWIQELDRRNLAVERLIEGRFEEGAGRSTLVMKDVRAEVDAAYGSLVDMFFAQSLVATLGTDTAIVATYDEAAARWNEIIDRTSAVVAAREGRAKAKKEAEEAAEEAGTGEAGATE
jgi:hypothetical protein